MKLSIFILLLFVFSVSASEMYSQVTKLSLSVKNESIENVLRKIEDQSEYRFFYSGKIDATKIVSVESRETDIREILDEILGETAISYRIVGRQIALFSKDDGELHNSSLQLRQVRGKVTGSNGESLPGVSIAIKRTSSGTVTDIDGNYTLTEIQDDAVLVFSFIGMAPQEIPVKGRNVIDVIMEEETIGLDEVIAIGYGTMKKSDLTGTVVRADLESFREAPNVNIMQYLQGTIAGVNVAQTTGYGEAPAISIRGRNTISGTTSPLIVLDGVIFRGNMSDLNPHDIQTIDVLKDASAAAIYGSQASNGVIIVTTKRGKDEGKPIISYGGSFALQAPSNNISMNNTAGYINKIKQIYLNEAYTAESGYTVENSAFDVSSKLSDVNAINGYNNGVDLDWWDLLAKKYGYVHDHNIGIRGHSNATGYFFSIGYADQRNILANSKYQRYSIRINLDNQIAEWLKVGVQSFLSTNKYPGASPSAADMQQLVPVAPAYDSSGDIIQYPYKSVVNPLLTIRNDYKKNRLTLTGNFYADISVPFIKGLSYRVNISQSLTNNREYAFNYTANSFQGSAYKNHDYRYEWMVDNIVTYQRTFGDHSVNVTGVYGAEKREYESTDANAAYFDNQALSWNYLEASEADQQSVASSAWKESSLYQMLRAYYSYKNRYMFTGTVRRDGFSGFGEANKFGVFPSGALAWVASEESFLNDNAQWLDLLKVRLSYGVNGNRTLGRYSTQAKVSSETRYVYGDGGNAVIGQWVSSLANKDLKWETTETTNIGFDFAMLNNRLSGALEIYFGKTRDMLYSVEIPWINGLGTMDTNIGKMKNKGVELTLNGTPVLEKDFRWDVAFTFSLNRNKVVSINGSDVDGNGIEDDIISSSAGNSIFMNKPYGVLYDYDIQGIWQIEDGQNIPDGFTFGTYKIRDISGPEGKPDGAWSAAYDRNIVGYKDPSYRFGIKNAFKYKNFDLMIFINSVQGGSKYYKGVAAGNWLNIDNLSQNNSPEWDYWTPTNTGAKYRRLGDYPKSVGESVHPYSSRSFVRLQDVTLSYTFSPAILKSIGLNFLKVYVSGKNLATWTKWEGYDPETGTWNSNTKTWDLGAGTALVPGNLPVLRSYAVGLNIEF